MSFSALASVVQVIVYKTLALGQTVSHLSKLQIQAQSSFRCMSNLSFGIFPLHPGSFQEDFEGNHDEDRFILRIGHGIVPSASGNRLIQLAKLHF